MPRYFFDVHTVTVTRDDEGYELAMTMITEQPAGERIEDEDRRGNYECRDATIISVTRICASVEADRADLRKI